MSKVNAVVRVAVNNNFNCTSCEWNQLERFNETKPNLYFINCNIRTRLLSTVNQHDFKVVVTVNPDLLINRKQIERLYEIDKSLVAFVRIKYIPNDQSILDLANELNNKGYNVVFTIQRFNIKTTAMKYVPNYRMFYKWGRKRWRLLPRELDKVIKFADENGMYICDKLGYGCRSCRLCSLLTFGVSNLPIKSLNLSSSGICRFRCPDCYAHEMQTVSKRFGNRAIVFDKIKTNKKQSKKAV